MVDERNPPSLSISVSHWLENVPQPSIDCEVSPKKSRGGKRKRTPESDQQPQEKSQRLGEISGNVMRRTSPLKQPPKGADDSSRNTPDLDQTPKASRLHRLLFDGGSDALHETYDRPATEQSHISSQRSDSTASLHSRSRSPTKHLGDTQFSNMPINIVSMANNVPEEVQRLVHDLRKISKGQGVIPRQIQYKMGEEVEEYELMDSEEVDHPDDLDHEAFWVRTDELWHIALDCLENSAPEATWNGEVHCQLLRLSLRGRWKSKDIWYQDVTTARIVDKTLIPSVATIPMQSKLVDYAMTIHSDADFKDRIIAKLSGQPTVAGQRLPPSINSTCAEWIRFRPIAVSIETKSEADHRDSGNVQLGIWAAAHFLKLQQLSSDRCSLPVLPVVYVIEHQWKLMLACMATGPRIELLSYILLGDTSTLSGVYRVVAAIRRLARWIDEQYRPWFEKEVLADRVAHDTPI